MLNTPVPPVSYRSTASAAASASRHSSSWASRSLFLAVTMAIGNS
jgi:hypothetical protein